jgi:hypothetical protein
MDINNKKMKKINISLLTILLVFQFSAQNSMPKRSYAVDWVLPLTNSNPTVSKFDKIELGVNIDDADENKIINYIKNINNAEKLNPFNPEDIDIYAEFYNPKLNKTKRINAFFYEEFKRNTASSNYDDWNWQKLQTNTKFRLRFTPNETGKWSFQVFVKIKNKELVKLGPYEFSCKDSEKPGYVKVASNNKYLELGGKSYLPIGQNLPKATCYFLKDKEGNIIDDPYSCSTCTCASVEEWCPHLRHLPMNPKAYMVYIEELEKFKKAGADYFRFIIFPHTYEIEYDKLGNYYDRLNVAWELDKMIEKAEKLDLKMHFNMFLGYPLVRAHYGVDAWDWYADNENDKGYCYRTELNLKEPAEFLTNPEAIRHFKNRTRYLIARWGYSTSIAIFEFMSEINNKFADNPKELYIWQLEMTRYIKEELGHNEHILTVNYHNGRPNLKGGDKSFSIPHIDILTYNIHRGEIYRAPLQRNYKMYEKHNKPLIFSEIGTGDSEFELCDNNTEWYKDLWATIFSGTASAGINWNEQHNYKLWENFKIVKDFTKNINFNEFSEQYSFRSKNKLVEAIGINDVNMKKSIGMIQNTTWNYYTMSTGGSCKTTNIPKKKHQTFVSLNSNLKKNRITLKGFLAQKEYEILWFNPFTNEVIGTVLFITSNSGKIEMNYPELTKSLPFLCYKIIEKGNVFSNSISSKTEEKLIIRKDEKKLK